MLNYICLYICAEKHNYFSYAASTGHDSYIKIREIELELIELTDSADLLNVSRASHGQSREIHRF